MYNNQKESKITNRIEFNLTGEQIKKLLQTGELTLIQENYPNIVLNVDSNFNEYDKAYVKTKRKND